MQLPEIEACLSELIFENYFEQDLDRKVSNDVAIHSIAIHHLLSINAEKYLILRSTYSALNVDRFDISEYFPVFLLVARNLQDEASRKCLRPIYLFMTKYKEDLQASDLIRAAWNEMEALFL